MKKTLSLTLALTLLLGVTGCSGSQNPSASTTAAPTAAESAASSDTEAPAAGYRKSLVIGIDNAITTQDPQATNNFSHNILFKMTHDRLVAQNTETLEIEPELATEWQWNGDQEIVFKLRDDVSFSNGDHMTAADVVYTIERAKGPESTVGDFFVSIEQAEAVDDYTVRITLSQPNVDLLPLLSYPHACILSKAACEADPTGGSAVGSGAFIVEELVASDYVKLKRNDSYWGEMPNTEQMTIRYIPEDSARVIALQNGEINVCTEPSNTELHFISDDPNLSLVQLNSSSCVYLAFDTSEAPGNDENLRLAVAHALNLDDIITVAADGQATKAVSNWGLSTYGYYDDFGNYEQNLELAKEYLAKSYPNGGAKLEISTTGNERVTVAQVIQEQCRAIGLEVTVNEVEAAALTAMSKFNVAEHEAMVYNLGWREYGDDASRPFGVDSNTNKAIVSDPRIQELLVLARGEQDDAQRKEYYKEIQEINHEKAYYIPIYFAYQYVGITEGLEGVDWQSNRSHDFTYACIPE